MLLNIKSNAETYGVDYFGEEYSNGYIRNVTSSDVITKSGEIAQKKGSSLASDIGTSFKNNIYYTYNNTSKSVYVDYSKAARYIDNNGKSIWLDMRLYLTTNNKNYPWALRIARFEIENLYNATQRTYIEFHFYTEGHCGEPDYEQSFKGVTRFDDLDTKEGIMIYSGYNRFFKKAGAYPTYVAKGATNSTNVNNPFSRSGTAKYPYFFGTRENKSTDNVWIEIDSTPDSPFCITYGIKDLNRGTAMYFTGTPIEYYVDGELKETSYCVPYGTYKLINPSNISNAKKDYTIDGWYTDDNYNEIAQGGIAGESTIKIYGKYLNNYTVKYNGNGSTSGSTANSAHVYSRAKKLNQNGFEKKYTVKYNHNYPESTNETKIVTYNFKNWNTKSDGTGNSYNNTQSVINLTSTAGGIINLYAIWEPTSVSYIPEREGYSFRGWYLDEECTSKVTDSQYTPTQNTTLYAKWEKDYTITIDNDRVGHTYNAYQVFQGEYLEKESENKNEIPILSNIEWSSNLQKEIITRDKQDKGNTHGSKIIELLKTENSDLYGECENPEDIANKLQGKTEDGEVIREFTDICGKYILDNDIPVTKGTNEVVEEKDNNGNIIATNYKITHLDPGYYIVIDADANEKDDSYSRYLIGVVKDITISPKTSTPRLYKKVNGNNLKTKVEEGTNEENTVQYVEDDKRNTAIYKEKSEKYNAEDYDIKFELQSYIPETDSYSNYKFKIVDILSKGFELDTNSIKVMLGEKEYLRTRERVVKGNSETGEQDRTETVENYTILPIVINADNYETYKNYFEEEGKKYPENYAQSNYGKTIILLELQDLVGQMKDKFVAKEQDIFVRYNAKLNGKGEVGNTPNVNEAYLQYSNNPYDENQTAQTTTQITYTYTIDLNLSKIAEIKNIANTTDKNVTNNENIVEEQNTNNAGNKETPENTTPELTYLAGAEFEIYNGPEYIKEEDSLIPNKNKNRKLIATIKTDEILDSEGNIINEAGHVMYESLGAGTYYIKETKAPEGYNKLREEIKLEIKATCDELGTITWEIEAVENKLVLAQIEVKEITEEKANEETGETNLETIRIPEVKLQVENTSGLELPVTGGIGTIIFTVVGLNLMLIAVKSSKKKIK